MGEDASWSLELVETGGRAGRDGRRCDASCSWELVDSWAGSYDALERGDSWEE